jgi:hypothetical protein
VLPPRASPWLALLALLACAPARRAPAPLPAAPPAAAAPAPSPAPRLRVRRPSPDEAFAYLFGVLRKMPFFRAHGYRVGLPQHPAFVAAAEAGHEPAPEDWNRYRQLFVDEVYRASDYDAALASLAGAPALADAALRRLAPLHERWGFRVYPAYEVVLTLYGPGGSYDARTGTITLLPRAKAGASDGTASQTVVHEIVHMGIEEAIVRRFGLPHEVKERLVDRICLSYLADVLPGYKAQPMGPIALDAYVDAKAVLDLPAAVQAYLREHPIGAVGAQGVEKE